MGNLQDKRKRYEKRKLRVRRNISGTSTKPRVSIFRSNKFFYAQAINDMESKTLVSIKSAANSNVEEVTELGANFAKELKKLKLDQAVYDRNGYKYHGKVAAFAEGMRKEGINL
jgi:large subunit ribosomal protein L18